MSLNALVRSELDSRASARALASEIKAHPFLKLFLFVLLTFLIFSKLGIMLHLSLFVFTFGVLFFSGCLKNLYKKLIALYLGIYCFLFFVNWIFNKNPGFWDKNYLNSQFYDFGAQISKIFSRLPFSSSTTSSNGSASGESIETGFFLGGEVVKGCIKNGAAGTGSCSCSNSGTGCTAVAVASSVEELKKVCGCCVNGSGGGSSCCSNGSGSCNSTYPGISKMKTFAVLTSSGKKYVGFIPKWYTFTLLQTVLAFNISNKLVMIIALSRALSHTTDLTAFTHAVGHFIKPLSFFRVPVKEITLIISLAIRFIPSLLSETMRIVKAQSSRGIDFKNGRLRDKVSAFLSLFIPLFIISMIKSKELANAMISRAYLPKATRTNLRSYHLYKKHLIGFSSTLTFIVLCFYFVASSYYFSPFNPIDPLLLLAT
ncbi:energy-coupling factor transporter transmembrane component T [Candidatus Mycoplasma haematominutum]|uniref:Cobalt ABC transporter, permease n=1 Tax=Candidatus Mycoplasma haematominutum 'Birmingham 1' TaxID=1116213 RepID=G8C2Z5_9MOLU|nr:energy-coupling factor transporter transmembrane component T [Candidatus Mycoplasma haematominutum]CCE66693.1 cobalt ABC transporter, permease [Candidatus Mycoplasma haematominutum 'Birmingham 1']